MHLSLQSHAPPFRAFLGLPFFPFPLQRSRALLPHVQTRSPTRCLRPNILLSMYSFCGFLHNAYQVFNEIPLSVCDVVSWNSMVSGCIQGRCYWDALKVFDEMLKCNVNARPDEVTIINALTACARIGFLNMGRKIHGLLVRNDFDSQSYPILTEVFKQ